MRQLAASALALVLGAAAAFALVSCGGGEDAKLLPGTTAQEISENLGSVKQFVGEGECVGAQNAAQEVSAQVEALGEVDEKLKQALQRGAERLDEVVASCEEAEAETVAPSEEAPSTEEEELPPGLEKKAEKEREKEEKALEKEAEKQDKQEEKEATPAPPPAPAETTPAEPPPGEGGGTGASGGVAPGAPVEGGE